MQIELTKQEVEKILLDYANKVIEGYCFNAVVSGSYRELPDTVKLVKVETKDEHKIS